MRAQLLAATTFAQLAEAEAAMVTKPLPGESPLGKALADRDRVFAKSGTDSADGRAAQHQVDLLAGKFSPEDLAEKKAQAVEKRRAENETAGVDAVQALLEGSVKPPEGRAIDQQALVELRKRGLKISDYPELQNRIAEHAPIKNMAEATSYVGIQATHKPR